MKQSTYEVEAQVERDHWWFRGRRKVGGLVFLRSGHMATIEAKEGSKSTSMPLQLAVCRETKWKS